MNKENDVLSQLATHKKQSTQQTAEPAVSQVRLYMQQDDLEDYLGFPPGSLSYGLSDKKPKLPYVVIGGIKYLNRIRVEEIFDAESRRVPVGSDRLPEVMPLYGSYSLASAYTGLPETWLRSQDLPVMKSGNKAYIHLPQVLEQLTADCMGESVNAD